MVLAEGVRGPCTGLSTAGARGPFTDRDLSVRARRSGRWPGAASIDAFLLFELELELVEALSDTPVAPLTCAPKSGGLREALPGDEADNEDKLASLVLRDREGVEPGRMVSWPSGL